MGSDFYFHPGGSLPGDHQPIEPGEPPRFVWVWWTRAGGIQLSESETRPNAHAIRYLLDAEETHG